VKEKYDIIKKIKSILKDSCDKKNRLADVKSVGLLYLYHKFMHIVDQLCNSVDPELHFRFSIIFNFF